MWLEPGAFSFVPIDKETPARRATPNRERERYARSAGAQRLEIGVGFVTRNKIDRHSLSPAYIYGGKKGGGHVKMPRERAEL